MVRRLWMVVATSLSTAVAPAGALRAASAPSSPPVSSSVESRAVLDQYCDGRLQQQKARIVVLACNGIGTPRLLLNSKSSLFPGGLANSSGLVGKGLMGHPKATVVGLFENEGADAGALETASLTSDQFAEGDTNRGFARGFWIMSGVYGGPIEAALGQSPAPLASAIPPDLQGGARVKTVAWGAGHHEAFQTQYGRSVAMSVYCDELPEAANRVELHPTLTDDTGIAAPKLVYRRGENTEKMLAFGMERAKQALLAAGATRILSAEKVVPAPGHYLGTARMGSDPQRSVVDKWGRAHDVKNLFIIDGSVFTTASGVVPTSTIQAIAVRTADYFRNNARNILP